MPFVARSRLKSSAHHHDCRCNVFTSDSRCRSSSSKLNGDNRGACATGYHPSSAMVRRASFRQRPLPPKQLLGCCVQKQSSRVAAPSPLPIGLTPSQRSYRIDTNGPSLPTFAHKTQPSPKPPHSSRQPTNCLATRPHAPMHKIRP